MTQLTIPNPDVNIVDGNGKIDRTWYRKLSEWIKRTNQAEFTTNGKLTVSATSDTNIRLSYIGSDGTTRTADITLS